MEFQKQWYRVKMKNASYFKITHVLFVELSHPRHIPHTWGTQWNLESLGLHFIIASDILLYVR